MGRSRGCGLAGAVVLVALAGCEVGTNPVESADQAPPRAVDSRFVLVSPNDGEAYRVGDTVAVSWQLDSSLVDIAAVILLEISLDRGKSYAPLMEGYDIDIAAFGGARGSYPWVVPDTLYATGQPTRSDGCLIRISTYSEEFGDVSDAPFRIEP